jgi:Holliday junction DNA helicase RuvA
MIASLKGRLESLGGDGAVIDVGGIGFRVYMPTSTLTTLGAVGSEVKLHTHLHLREDNATLYGFASTEELELFRVLIGITGLGPRLALAVLSAMDVESLAAAVTTGNADLLTGIPGIGKKMASRLVLELKDRLGAGWAMAPAAQIAQEDADVLAALTSLGYSVSEATRAVAGLPREQKLSLEDKVRLALGYLGSKP